MDIGSKEFQEYADKANIPNSYRIWANCMWKEAQRQAINTPKHETVEECHIISKWSKQRHKEYWLECCPDIKITEKSYTKIFSHFKHCPYCCNVLNHGKPEIEGLK